MDIDRPNEYKRSPLKMMGSKWASLEHILEEVPEGSIWVDVFGGSGIVTLNVDPFPLEIFNDINSGVAAFFEACQIDPSRLIQIIHELPHSRELYQRFLTDYKLQKDTCIRGAMWYYLVRTSYGGKVAAGSWGYEKKAPNIAAKKIADPKNLELFRHIKERFCSGRLTVENRHWRDLVSMYDSKDTVFYMDPPYVDCNDYGYKMIRAEHQELCQTIFELDGFVLLSGYDNPIYSQWDWDETFRWKLKNSLKDKVDRFEYLWIKENNI